PDDRLASPGDRREVSGGSARHEDAGRLVRIVDPLPEPVEDGQLELARSCGFPPGSRIDVRGRGDEVAERRGPRPGARDIAEEARVVEVADERQDVTIQSVEEPVECAGSR